MNSKQFKKTLIFLLLLFTVHCSLFTDSYALEFKKQTSPSGLTILHVERHNLPIVMVTLLIKASPLDESAGKAGIANLTAKMLTEGTLKKTALEIKEEIEFIGANLDTSVNSDYTTVSLSVLKKDIEDGFDIFFDILLNPLFLENELKRKKELIKGSLRHKEEDSSFVANKAFTKEVFKDHPYGRLTAGSMETIDNIRGDDILKFYQQHYLPGNAIISVVGDITSEELNFLMDKYLGQWKAKNRGQKSVSSGDPPRWEVRGQMEKKHKDKKVVIIDRDITQANIVLGHSGISRDNPDYYAVSVANYILGGGGFASRLMQVIRDEMGLAYSIFSSFSVNKEPGQFKVEVQTENKSAGIVIKEILKQINKMTTVYVSDDELKNAKAYLTGSFPRRLETSRKIANFLAAVEFYNLGDDYSKKYSDYINEVTKEDVLRVAKKYLDTENYILVIVGKKELLDLSNL